LKNTDETTTTLIPPLFYVIKMDLGFILTTIVVAIVILLIFLTSLALQKCRICKKCGWHNYNRFGNKCPNCKEPYKKKE